MTLGYTAGPTALRAVYKDNHGKISVKDYIVPTGVWDPGSDLLSALVTIRDALVVQINLNTKALLINMFISIKQTEDTLTIPASDCHVNEMASVILNLEAGDNKKTTLQIPAPVDAMFQGASGPTFDDVKIDEANLGTLVDMFQTTGGSFTLSDGETVDDTVPIVSGRRIFRKTGAKKTT